MTKKTDNTIRILKYVHFIATVLLFVLGWTLHKQYIEIIVGRRYDLFVIVLYALMLYFFTQSYDCYLVGYKSKTDLVVSQSLSTLFSDIGIYIMISVVWNHFYTPMVVLLMCLTHIVFNVLWTAIMQRAFRKVNSAQKTVILYNDDSDLKRLAEFNNYGYSFEIADALRIESESTDLNTVLAGYNAVVVSGVDASLRNDIAQYCIANNLTGYFVPHIGDIIMSGAKHVKAFSVLVQGIERANPDSLYILVKRAFDIVVSMLSLIILSPLFCILSLCIKLDSKGSAIYRQIRLTKDGKEFEIYKFRSMRVDSESDGVARLATENDDRITRIGKVLRACRLDELPQLVNIFKGDMSFVGPRPERPEIANEYEKTIPAFALRLQVKAGLTGYAQVYGRYNTDPYDKLEMDLLYINKMSIVTDLELIFATLKILLEKEKAAGVEEGKITAR